jgi:protein gp37
VSQETAISWCDHTFNPWWGCVKVSPACQHCYAETFSKRVGQKVWGIDAPRRFFGPDHWNEPLKWNAAAVKAGVRRRVFCASMADVFEDRPEFVSPRADVFLTVEETPMLDWLILTKRPENILRLMPKFWKGRPWPNVWFGATVESQEYAAPRLSELLDVPAVVHFVSAEPLLGPLDLTEFLPGDAFTHSEYPMCAPLTWVIAGGESGPHARPSHPEWFRSLRDQCQLAGVPFHFKQWGEWLPGHQYTGALAQRDSSEQFSRFRCLDWYGDHYGEADQFEDMSGDEVYRVGKKAAGRLLDDREWLDFPRQIQP